MTSILFPSTLPRDASCLVIKLYIPTSSFTKHNTTIFRFVISLVHKPPTLELRLLRKKPLLQKIPPRNTYINPPPPPFLPAILFYTQQTVIAQVETKTEFTKYIPLSIFFGLPSIPRERMLSSPGATFLLVFDSRRISWVTRAEYNPGRAHTHT